MEKQIDAIEDIEERKAIIWEIGEVLAIEASHDSIKPQTLWAESGTGRHTQRERLRRPAVPANPLPSLAECGISHPRIIVGSEWPTELTNDRL